MNRKRTVWTLLVSFSLLLAACRSQAPEATTTQPATDPNAVFTAAAQTAQARMTELSAVTPTVAVPITPTATLAPTSAAPVVTSTLPTTDTFPTAAVGTPAPTVAIPGAQNTAAPPAPPAVTSGDVAAFVSDVTVPDGTDFDPGESFVKTWRIQNAGTTTWTTDYALIYSSGAQMEGPNTVPMPTEVAPGATVDISVDMVAPEDVGSYTGFWMLRNAAGTTFGIGTGANQPFYVQITVGGGGAAAGTPAAVNNTGGTANNTPVASGDTVTGAILSVSPAEYNGACPAQFTLNGQFTLAEASQVSYSLEASTQTRGFDFGRLPEPVTDNFEAGTNTVGPYNLEFTVKNKGDATFQLHFLEPDEVVSNVININIQCQ